MQHTHIARTDFTIHFKLECNSIYRKENFLLEIYEIYEVYEINYRNFVRDEKISLFCSFSLSFSLLQKKLYIHYIIYIVVYRSIYFVMINVGTRELKYALGGLHFIYYMRNLRHMSHIYLIIIVSQTRFEISFQIYSY